MTATSIPSPSRIRELAADVAAARIAVNSHPVDLPSWRDRVVAAEHAWQKLVEYAGHTAAITAMDTWRNDHPIADVPLSPYAYSPIERRHGRTWVRCQPDALLHPSASGQCFQLDELPAEYHLVAACRLERAGLSPLVVVETEERDTALMIMPDVVVHLELVL